jgi:hypothetical protein
MDILTVPANNHALFSVFWEKTPGQKPACPYLFSL